jgi:hypothetical protein
VNAACGAKAMASATPAVDALASRQIWPTRRRNAKEEEVLASEVGDASMQAVQVGRDSSTTTAVIKPASWLTLRCHFHPSSAASSSVDSVGAPEGSFVMVTWRKRKRLQALKAASLAVHLARFLSFL